MTPRPLGPDRPYLERVEPLPRRLEDVTPEWLTRLLGHRFPGIVVHGFDRVELKNSHTTKLRVRVELNDVGTAAGLPEHVCLKANWSGLRTGLICEREARFYHLISQGLDAPVPRAYFADWDDDGRGNGLVVMEDLAVSQGHFGSSDDHLGIDGVAAGLESLARVHSALWGDPRLDAWTWLASSMGTENDTEQVRDYWNYIMFNLGDPEYEAVVPRWVYETPEVLHHVLDGLSEYERSLAGPRCLVHGDAHQGNSFLRSAGERLWVDWQLVRKGTPWRDVSYFVVGALTVDERRTADRDLVEHYRRRLIASGAQGVPDRNEAWRNFTRWPAYGVQAWLGNINQWGQRSGVEMVRRQFAAFDDYDTRGILMRGRRPSRPFVPGEGAFPLAPALREEGERRARRRVRGIAHPAGARVPSAQRRRRPVVPSFPVHPSELTPAWLTTQLRSSGAITSSSVEGFTTSPVGEGIGMLGVLVRVELTYDRPEAGAPAAIVAKFATPIIGNRAVAMDYLLYEREVRFYKQLAVKAKAASPRCFGAEINPENGDFVLLLEDLTGYRVGDQVTGCSAEEAKQIIDAVAPLHAAYWGKVDIPELDIAPQISGKQQSDGITGGCQAGWDPAMQMFGDVIAPEIKASRDRFLAAVPELHLMMGRRTQTLIHCDVRLDNLMFGVEPGHHDVVLLDWSIAKSTGLQDIAYLTSQNVTIAERRAHETELVEYYQRRLEQLGVTTQSLEQTWADYKVAMLYVFCFAIVIGGTLDPSNDRGRAFMRNLIERSSAALMDHDLLSLLPT